MNQAENDELARRIVRHLDYGVDQLDPRARARLAAARTAALSHYREQREMVFGLAWIGPAFARITEHRIYGARFLGVVAALVIATASVVYWQNTGPANDLADIDTNLLTDELPINAYLDKGFDSWLKRSLR